MRLVPAKLTAEQYARTEALRMVMARRSPADLITEEMFGVADRLARYILTGEPHRPGWPN